MNNKSVFRKPCQMQPKYMCLKSETKPYKFYPDPPMKYKSVFQKPCQMQPKYMCLKSETKP